MSNNWTTTGFHGMAQGFMNNPTNNRKAVTQNMYANHLIELCANRFEWTGLPPSVDPRFLELNLLRTALAVFFKDEGSRDEGFTNTGEFYCLQAAGGGMLNIQDVPTHFQVTAPNVLLNVRLPATGKDAKCVPIWANYLRRPELDKIALFSQKLAEVDRTIEIAEMNLRHTRVLRVPENKRSSYVNLMQKHAEGVPYIFGTENMNVDETMEAFDVGGNPQAVSTLWDAKNQRWNEAMTFLGINNSNQDKKERLVAAEVGANDEQVEATRTIALNSRQYAAKQINELYGLNVWVEFRGTIQEESEDEDDENNDVVDDENGKDAA